jgi:serine/threonine-protein kinase HipA
VIKHAKSLDVYISSARAGTLAITADNICVFEYDKGFLESGFNLSPFYLPLKSGVFKAKAEPFNGLFGVFADCLPDGWGRLLIDRLLIKHKIELGTITQLDRLAMVGKSGMGALEYSPVIEFYKSRDTEDINFLAEEVKKVLNENYSGSLEALAKKGGSSGGARPKALIKIDNEEWLVKFPNSDDMKNIGEAEYNYSIAAKNCGIDMPETRMFEGKYFGVKRFDRKNGKKIHMHSFAGMLNSDFRVPSLDYVELFKTVLAVTKDMSEVLKIYRQMVFNVLTHNRDDHAKNFSFIFDNGKWQVSPAYDLVYSNGFNGQHTTTVNGSGLPEKEDILAASNAVGINKKTALKIYDEIKDKTISLKNIYLKNI